jgi:hypothetical protein
MRILAVIAMTAIGFAAGQMPFVQPAEFAASLAKSKTPIFYVGPNVLFRSKHIPGAVFAGPGQKPEGIALLKEAVAKLPRDREIVIYCGCCPWDHCPNMTPAFEALRAMGFTKVRGLNLPDNFKTDWIDKGYPVE